MAKNFSFAPSLVASTVVHLAVLLLAAALISHGNHLTNQQLISIALVEPTHEIEAIKPRRQETPHKERIDVTPGRMKRESLAPEPPLPPVTNNGVSKAKAEESKAAPTPLRAPAESTPAEGGGSAVAGLGRGSGVPGLPAHTTMLRTSREAKPIQTARAVYPPMALRAGLESDVMLKIEVDAQGKVTQAEIIKSGGAGFDEEALKAVKRSRFEPAQRDGQHVAAEFTYIYRFRLHR